MGMEIEGGGAKKTDGCRGVVLTPLEVRQGARQGSARAGDGVPLRRK